ncbi:MAG: CDC48 family AAA ATPase [Nitrososphaeria archaeon]|nr:CDC48 family AAA ATPase [Nitrososphaeria archaeon]
MDDVQLRVLDSRQRDVARGVGRIDEETMQELGVSAGDGMEIVGSKKTSVIAWPSYSGDQGRGVIRIDGLTRKNAGVSINEYATVRKAKVEDAKSIVFAPVDMRLNVDQNFMHFVKNRLMDRTFVEGDITLVMMLGHPLQFTVRKTRPDGIVRLTSDTKLQVLGEPTPEAKGMPQTTYEDIGGLEEEIRRIREMVELPMRHPEIFQRLGIDPPKGVLLQGPPGCGKTLLARAVANESDVNFLSINGPEIMSKFYGQSEKRLRKMFQEAQKNAPAIIFIDELDAIAPKRGEVRGEVERRVVAQLLALMDGLAGRGNVIVIGATNRVNALDPALRRPGRFDREIEIGIPDKPGRREILLIHSRGMPLAENVDLRMLSERTHGYTGADLAALCRETAMKALRRYLPEIDLDEQQVPPGVLEKMNVTMDDFMDAFKEITPTAMREIAIEIPAVHWEEVGDLEDVKQDLRESVEWPLKKSDAFERMGIQPPRGILLYGPPGCGKTLLARAVATESEANFITIKGPEVFSKWVGESEKAVREVFRKARTSSPAVLFFDEIDSLVPRRGAKRGSSKAAERVISQLLTEMDGIAALQDVVVLAATNRPDIVDPAILRPGRFDRLIYVPEPDKDARQDIFKIHAKEMPLSEDVDLGALAGMTKGYSGADIESVCREAALIKLRRDIRSEEVTFTDFQQALQKVQPSITSDMQKWYQRFKERVRRVEKPMPIVA